MRLRNTLAVCAILALSVSPVLAEAPTVAVGSVDDLYVADYGAPTGSGLIEYSATLTETSPGNYSEVLTSATPIASFQAPTGGGQIHEGVSGTANDVITIVQTPSNGWELARYTSTGTFIGYVGGGHTTFTSIGSFVLSQNGQDAYVADDSDNGGEVVEVSLATGSVVGTPQLLAGVHDVSLLTTGPNAGNVIAESLNGNGIDMYTPNFASTTVTDLIQAGTPGEAEPGTGTGNLQGNNQYGFAIDSSGDIWTVSDNRSSTGSFVPDIDNESGTVYEFSPTGAFMDSWTLTDMGGTLSVKTDYINTGTTTTGNLSKIDDSTNNPYATGISFGPDGNLYLADLGGVVVGDNPDGNNVGEFNTSTDTFSTFIAGDTSGTVNPSTGLSAPKYINWQTAFIPADDAGVVPEPDGAVTTAVFTGTLGLLMLGAFRRSKRISKTQ